jgi:hypothetical protein
MKQINPKVNKDYKENHSTQGEYIQKVTIKAVVGWYNTMVWIMIYIPDVSPLVLFLYMAIKLTQFFRTFASQDHRLSKGKTYI